MTISATYGVLQHQIADELGDRTDLLAPLGDSDLTLSPIQNAIQSAISKWEREPFYFNEAFSQNLFNTVVAQEFYTTAAAGMIATSPYLMRLHVLVGANRYPIELRTWAYLEDTSVNPNNTGQPFDYAYLAEQIRLYPIPDGIYPITLTATQRLTSLNADADSNVWTNDAYDLIRSEAKLILAQETLHDDEIAGRMRTAIYGDPRLPGERGYLYALKAESTRRARARVIPTYF